MAGRASHERNGFGADNERRTLGGRAAEIYFARIDVNRIMGRSFFDAAYGDVTSFFGKNIDPDMNGKANVAANVNSAWRAGMSRLISNTRKAIGPEKIIVNNSSSAYSSQVNGGFV